MKPLNAVFTFLALAAVIDADPDYSKIGKYSILMEHDVVCIHSILLPNSKLLCIERPHVEPYPVNARTNGRTEAEADLINKKVTISPVYRNAFCAGHAQMADGNILVIGGDFPNGVDQQGNVILTTGIAARRVYRPCADGDTSCEVGRHQYETDMTTGRWYPTVTTLYNGKNIIVSGSLKNLDFANLSNTNNPTYEYYPSKTEGVWPRTLDVLNWAFPWNLYPAVYQLHNGKVMMFVSNRTVLLDPDTDQLDETSVSPILLEDKWPWIYPNTPTFVMFPLTIKNQWKSEIMACGGSRRNLDADNRCIGINFGEENPQWRPKTNMPIGRLMPDTAILADGKILFTNGAGYGLAGGDAGSADNAYNPIFDNQIYDPETNQWAYAGTMTVPRLYHSGAILLADGRVVITGSEEQNYVDVATNKTDCMPFARRACTPPFEYRIEVYEPPYLFMSGQRPVIESAPKSTTYKSKFAIKTGTDAGVIDKVHMIRYSTSTHSINMDQRLVELEVVSRNRSYMLLKAPDNGKIAPPGNYHLFILRNGFPAVAKTVLLKDGEMTEDAEPLNPIKPIGIKNDAVVKKHNGYMFPICFAIILSVWLS